MFDDVLTTRRFRRNASLGMQVWRSATVNLDNALTVEHIEIECPNYELTDNGPIYKRKKKETKE